MRTSTATATGRLGIIAGGGLLPVRLVAACQAQARPFLLIGLQGHADPALYPPDLPQTWIRLGSAASGFPMLRQQGVTELVLAGSVRRPSLREMAPDIPTARFFGRLGLRALGDDGMLKATIDLLESEGFTVVGVDGILEGLLAVPGVWGSHRPDEQAEADIARGVEIAQAVGRLDIGQAVIVQQGIVLGVEAAEGTDGLIARAAGLKREGPGPVLVKMTKPGQERRVDLPLVGPDTVAAARAAGLAGIAVEAGATLVLDRAAMVEGADVAGLFLIGVVAP